MGKSSDRKNLAKIRKKIAYLYPNKDTDKIILKLKSTMDYYRKNNIVRAKRKKYNSKISLTNKHL